MNALADMVPPSPQTSPVRVLLFDDHWLVRYGLRQMLTSEMAATVTERDYSAADGQTVSPTDWDVVILSFVLPQRPVLDLLKQIHGASPQLPILVVGIHSEYHFTRRVLDAGAAAFFLRDSSPADLLAAVERARNGGPPVGLLPRPARAATDRHRNLSEREHEVLRHLASGQTVSQTAQALEISVKTVSTYRTRLLDKLGLQTNAALMRYALDEGLVE